MSFGDKKENYFMPFDLNQHVNINDLCPRGDFRVIRIFEEKTPPKSKEPILYLKKVLIDYKGMLLTERYVDMVFIRKYLKLFASKHLISNEPNAFFELVSKDNGKEAKLKCKFDEERFIYRAEADTILEGLHTAMEHYSKKYFDTGSNSIEALAYVDSVETNSILKSKITSNQFVQDAMQAACIKEGRRPD